MTEFSELPHMHMDEIIPTRIHDPARSSPQQHPHYLRRNEWLKHAAIEQLQFEEKATAHAHEHQPNIHPPSYYQHLITSTPNTEAERVEKEHTLHHMAVYDVDVTAPSPARINPEEIDIAVRWHGPLPLTKDGMLVLYDDDEVKQPKSARSTSVTRRTSTSVHEDTPKDGYKQGTTVTKDTIAWNLIQNKNQPSNDDEHAAVPPEQAEELDTNVYHGLTQTIVDQRQLRDGKNEIQEKRPNQLLKFIGYFTDSIGLLIIAAAIISAVLKSWADFSVITALLFINAIIGFVEEAKAESAVHALQQKLALKTHVLRTGDVRVGLEGSVTADEEDAGTSDGGGKLQVVSVKELVRGDIISLRLGDIVPADARLLGLNKQHVITGDVLMIDQSALTGESLPVEKGRGDMVYSGSTVKQGQMLAVVVQTGTRTFLGRAAHLISTTENSGHFQKVIGRIGHFLIGITLVLVVIILIVGVVGHGHSFLDELEQALVLTIAAIPVGMPTVLSVTMAVGSNQLAKKQVIVKRLTAVEEMAAVDILCSDKTGTLTLNELTLDEPFAVEGYDADELLLTAFLASESGCHDAIEECVRTTASKTLASLESMERAARNRILFHGFSMHISSLPHDPSYAFNTSSLIQQMSGNIVHTIKDAHLVLMGADWKDSDWNDTHHQAVKLGIPLIADTWIHDSNAQGKLLDVSSYTRHAATSIDKLQDLIKQRNAASNKSKSSRKVKVKGRSAVDDDSGLAEQAHVLEEGKDVWNVVLNQTDISRGQNSYYILQLLENDRGSGWYVFRKWGRIGVSQVGGKRVEEYSSKDDAKAQFQAIYADKTGNDWDTRDQFEKVPGKMYPVEVDYGGDDDLVSKSNITPGSQSKLDKRVQSLVEIFFDIQKMKDALLEMEIDMEKMPLGKLSKNHIKRGYSVLTEIQDVIKAGGDENQLLALSNQFYTLIPHDFGTKNAPLLRTEQQVKEKLTVIETLLDIEIATTMLREGMSSQEDPIDVNYKKLHTDIEPIEKDDPQYEMVEKYVAQTHAPTHKNYRLEVVDVFSLERENEAERYRDFEKDKNRQLLWHGSRTTNFVGILSQGLRIAPPEAPVTGYMFGKGVYFADMVTKSANYCFTNRTNNTGFLLLCEVALGDMYQIKQSEYMEKAPPGKLSTKGVGGTHPNPKEAIRLENGCVVPLGHPCPNEAAISLLYNEYIVYDVKQIRMKYLVRAKFNYAY